MSRTFLTRKNTIDCFIFLSLEFSIAEPITHPRNGTLRTNGRENSAVLVFQTPAVRSFILFWLTDRSRRFSALRERGVDLHHKESTEKQRLLM